MKRYNLYQFKELVGCDRVKGLLKKGIRVDEFRVVLPHETDRWLYNEYGRPICLKESMNLGGIYD